MTEDRVETHVLVDDDEGLRAMHFQEWWVRWHAAVPARRFELVGLTGAVPAPGVLDALRGADVVLLPPSNPVVSIGSILLLPGVRDALRGTRAPVVGVSPVISGRPVRGMADACLTAIGVETTAEAVAGLYRDFLDGWVVDDADAGLAGPSDAPGSRRHRTVARPLMMRDLPSAAAIAGAALDLALSLAEPGSSNGTPNPPEPPNALGPPNPPGHADERGADGPAG